MLEVVVRFPLLAFGTPGFAPDEHFSSTQPTDWSAMSLARKSDVKSHLSLRYRTETFLSAPADQSDAASDCLAEPGAINANSSDFAEDFVAEHSSPAVVAAPADPVADSTRLPAPTASKSAQT
jgi:hypothetical protein